jgi:hypothetical protein
MGLTLAFLATAFLSFLGGVFVAAFGQAAKRGQAPIWQRPYLAGEGPGEHVANALQMVRAWVFLDDAERAGVRGLEIIEAVDARLERALKQLRKVA